MYRNQILQGNVLESLKKLPDNTIDCLITSPPYYSLRAYRTTPVIWDADPNCAHEWQTGKLGLTNNNGTGKGTVKQKDGVNQNSEIEYGFCTKCGAWRGELGLEPTFTLYIQHLMQIFDEVKRVLKPTGTLFVNLGDTYASSPKNNKTASGLQSENYGVGSDLPMKRKANYLGVKQKSLIGIPDRFKIAMIDAGWICRNELIWYKRNCMPSSAKDRFTVDFEKIYFFTKQEHYYFETQYRPYAESTIKELSDKTASWNSKYDGEMQNGGVGLKSRVLTGIKFGGNKANGYGNPTYSGKEWTPKVIKEYRVATRPGLDTGNGKSGTSDDPNAGLHNSELSTKREEIIREIDGELHGSLMRCVWKNNEYWIIENPETEVNSSVLDITTRGFAGAHFATFPETLVEPMLKAGCPEYVCKKCGKPREPVYEPSEEYAKYLGKGWHDHSDDLEQGMQQEKQLPSVQADYKIVGLSDCGCGAGFEPGLVCDIFFGSGTVGLVALKHARNFLGLELNDSYIKMAKERLKPYLEQSRIL